MWVRKGIAGSSSLLAQRACGTAEIVIEAGDARCMRAVEDNPAISFKMVGKGDGE